MFFKRKPQQPKINCTIDEDRSVIYHLTVDIAGHPPIKVSSEDRRNLQHLANFIRSNGYSHSKAQQLCRTFQQKEISQGKLPECIYGEYLVVLYLTASTGSVLGKYQTAEQAYQDPYIQRTIADIASQFGYTPDYNVYLDAVDKGAYCTYGAYTILRGRITCAGLVRPVPTTQY